MLDIIFFIKFYYMEHNIQDVFIAIQEKKAELKDLKSVCKQIQDNSAEFKEIEEKMEALKKVKDTDDKEAIKKAADELAQVGQKVGAAMYQSQQAQTPPPGSGNNDEKKDEEKKDDKSKTVEGEYEEVK